MNQKKLRGLVLTTVILFVVFWAVIFSATNIDAVTNTTPTLYATNWSYQPFVSGVLRGPTATATLPPPTMTPGATSTNTPSPTATNEFQLSQPTLYDIDNEDGDGNYTVAWSAVTGANRYLLKENHNDTTWETIYDGPALSFDRSGLAPGNYCYNVRAFGPSGRSDWAGEKCTIVEEQPEPEYVCEFETLYEGPRSYWPDLELLYDGRVLITGTSDKEATIFDPQTRSFKQVNLPESVGKDAAVLRDGRVLLTALGGEPHSIFFDPITEEFENLEIGVDCLENYRISRRADLTTYCSDDNYALVYEYLSEYYLSPPIAYMFENVSIQQGKVFLISRDEDWIDLTLITNGIAGGFLVFDVDGVGAVYPAFDNSDQFSPPSGAATSLSYDKGTILFSGGTKNLYTSEYFTTLKSTYSINLENYTFKQTADLWQDRTNHVMLGLSDGNTIVLGGLDADDDGKNTRFLNDIEIYVPSMEKWYKAGSLNIARSSHEAIQLLNGEIFVYGGSTEPGPGYSYVAPPEIGRCEQVIKN